MPGPWTLGWEFVLALVTLLLATFTGWLAWTTRRLARTTADEVQGQTRPVVVPLRATFEALAEGATYFYVTIRLRNIGAGPALNLKLRIGTQAYLTPERQSHSDPFPALEAGGEGEGRIAVPPMQRDVEGPNSYHMRTSNVGIEYFDLAGRRYSTGAFFGARSADGTTGFSQLGVSAGSAPPEAPITGSALIENPLMAAQRDFQGMRGFPFAWRYHVRQDPDAMPRPLWPRLREAWRSMYPKFRRTRMQRLVWAHRAYKATLDKPVRPWVPGLLRRPYVTARGLRWGYRAYRNMRF